MLRWGWVLGLGCLVVACGGRVGNDDPGGGAPLPSGDTPLTPTPPPEEGVAAPGANEPTEKGPFRGIEAAPDPCPSKYPLVETECSGNARGCELEVHCTCELGTVCMGSGSCVGGRWQEDDFIGCIDLCPDAPPEEGERCHPTSSCVYDFDGPDCGSTQSLCLEDGTWTVWDDIIPACPETPPDTGSSCSLCDFAHDCWYEDVCGDTGCGWYHATCDQQTWTTEFIWDPY